LPITNYAERFRSEDIADGAVTQAKSPFALAGTVDNQSLKEGTVSGMPTDATGTQSIDVVFGTNYPAALDSALAILEGMTDTGAEVDNVRTPEASLGVSGFTISAEVKVSGAAGSDCAFRWLAWGH